ncbi:DNA polymerase III subunit gamma and tau, partial [Streptomyces sp. NPDC004031]
VMTFWSSFVSSSNWPTAAAPAAAPAAAAASGGAAPQGGGSAGVGDPSRVRQMWPQILEAVKSRRRLTWMLLFNNAQVSGFDGETLQIGFDNPGARNSFANNGSEDVLKQAISDALGVQWRIEAIVDPSGGGSGGGSGPGPGPAGGFGGGGGSAPGGFGGGAPGAPRPSAPPQAPQAPPPPASPDAYGSAQAPARTAPAATAPGGQTAPGGPGGVAVAGQGTAVAAPPAPRPAPSGPGDVPPGQASGGQRPRLMTDEVPPPIEDDIPEDDDPDLVDSALSGHDLFIRELGATVIEEIRHD